MDLSLQCSHCWGRLVPSLRAPAALLPQTQQWALPKQKEKRRYFPHKPSLCGPRAYIETPDPVYDFFNKVLGALPIVGLLSRILSDDGGIGSDRIQFKEFCTRVCRNFSSDVTPTFLDFEERHGKAARPQYVLFWCWAAALGAGLLKSEDMMMGATRLRVTFDIQYEEENLSILMDQASKKRQKAKSSLPFVPYEARAAIALDAICKCCIGKQNIEEEDAILLITMLQGVFPAADKEEIDRSVRGKLEQAEDSSSQGGDDERMDLLASDAFARDSRQVRGYSS